jgi:hypothetical protein
MASAAAAVAVVGVSNDRLLAYDSAQALRRARVPILAFAGAKGIRIGPADVALMSDPVPTDFTGDLLPDVTHVLSCAEANSELNTHRNQAKRPVDHQRGARFFPSHTLEERLIQCGRF